MVVQNGTRVTATLTITLDARYDMLDLFCHLSFVSSTGKQSSIRPAAPNIPSYTDICTTYYGIILVHGEITTAPENTAGKVGTSTYLNCTAVIRNGDYVTWNYQPAGDACGVRIYNSRDGISPDVSTLFGSELGPASGSYNLIVKNVSASLAVKFWCSFVFDTNTEASAYVIAVNRLSCPTSGRMFKQGDVISESCSVEYTGIIAPKLIWKYTNGTALENQILDVRNGKTVTATVNITLDARYDLLNLFCHLNFANEANQSSHRSAATNTPSYTDSCTTYYVVDGDVTQSPSAATVAGRAVEAWVIVVAVLALTISVDSRWQGGIICPINFQHQ
jgi:hypothetical protein